MNEVNAVPMVVKQEQAIVPKKRPEIIVLEQQPDKFEKSTLTPGGVLLAGGLAATTGTTVYKGAKAIIGKAINGVEGEISNYCNELGRKFAGIPNVMKVNAKYGAALATAVGLAALTFKDADKDGKLDIIEACQKFITPDAES